MLSRTIILIKHSLIRSQLALIRMIVLIKQCLIRKRTCIDQDDRPDQTLLDRATSLGDHDNYCFFDSKHQAKINPENIILLRQNQSLNQS